MSNVEGAGSHEKGDSLRLDHFGLHSDMPLLLAPEMVSVIPVPSVVDYSLTGGEEPRWLSTNDRLFALEFPAEEARIRAMEAARGYRTASTHYSLRSH